jgi:ceramide glucosyltransferase
MSAIRRDTLYAIGGFERLANCVAEDFAMGRFVTNAGQKVVLSHYACDTIVSDRNVAEMMRHEIYWQRCERACRPLDQFMSVITWPLPLLAVLLLVQPSIVGLSILFLEMALRIALHYAVRRNFRIATPAEPWMVPLRECACFWAWGCGLFGNSIRVGRSMFNIKDYRALMRRDREQAVLMRTEVKS